MISILMSTHNPIQEYFNKCLDSIFNQSYQNFELVLVDDGSDKKVIDLIDKNKYDISKIKYVRLDKNVGLPKALNIGLKHCEGEFIARMDDDDLMDENRLNHQLDFVNSNKLDGCFCNFDTIDDEDKVIAKNIISISSDKYLKQLLQKGNIFCHASLFVKKTVLESISGYDENLRYAQDSDLYIRILEKYKMDTINENLVQHRQNIIRNNKYRETLSLTYALFGAMNHYSNGDKLKISDKLSIIQRLLRYYVGIKKINKKRGDKNVEKIS